MRELAPGFIEYGTPGSSIVPPVSVSMAQAGIAMSRAGITEAMVDAAIEAMPAGQTKTETRIWWNRSNVVERNHPAVAALAPALGLSEEQVDDLFALARTL